MARTFSISSITSFIDSPSDLSPGTKKTGAAVVEATVGAIVAALVGAKVAALVVVVVGRVVGFGVVGTGHDPKEHDCSLRNIA